MIIMYIYWPCSPKYLCPPNIKNLCVPLWQAFIDQESDGPAPADVKAELPSPPRVDAYMDLTTTPEEEPKPREKGLTTSTPMAAVEAALRRLSTDEMKDCSPSGAVPLDPLLRGSNA